MSRSSPGRYALHEFAKNVFRVRAADGAGRALVVTRPNPHQWDVSGHDGTVVVTYDIFGDRGDGTYIQIDTTHLHANGPATWMWARGMMDRRVRLTLQQPAGENWTAASQLFATDDPLVFTAPNTRYLLDSPLEFGETKIYSFDAADGQQIRVALHHLGSEADAEEYVDGTRRIVQEMTAVFGELPRFDGGTYTFIADYLPWIDGDGMEHRNSTIVASRASLAQAGRQLLGTVAHEFFHAWNVERIRPASIEPFDFEDADMSGELWLAEGFTSYYGSLVMHRAGLTSREGLIASMAGLINAATSSPGTRFRSAVEMSQLAPFVDAASPVDTTYWDNTFLSYYAYGAAIALGLDLTLRDRSDGTITLDDYMRALWVRHGDPQDGDPPAIARPYSLADARDVLEQVSGDADFAAGFFERHIEGTETINYASLLERAGLRLQPVAATAAWLGASLQDRSGALVVAGPTSFGSPAYEAGMDDGDTLLSLGGVRVTTNSAFRQTLATMRPGERVEIRYRRRDGSEQLGSATLRSSPALRVVALEQLGSTPARDQLIFREAWLTSRR
jgi:predicted metalloprotease with PDZ domain